MTSKSILTDVKKLIGITEEDQAFDTDIRVLINSSLARLSQLGVESSTGKMQITGYDETWGCLFGDNEKLNQIQEYIFLRTKLVFDPPSSATTTQTFKERVQELEWEINTIVDH